MIALTLLTPGMATAVTRGSGPAASSGGTGGTQPPGTGQQLQVTVPSRTPGTGGGTGNTGQPGTGQPGISQQGTSQQGTGQQGIPVQVTVPSGAPGTGGGTGPGGDLAMAVGGLAIMACGGGLVLSGWRRRRGVTGAAGP